MLLTSSQVDPDWPDTLDRETGVFTYYGDNKKPGRELHDTPGRGNLLLRRLFDDAQRAKEGRSRVPPIFLFARSGQWRDMIFLGLAVPGTSESTLPEDLVPIWRTAGGLRFQNYRARFTVLDAPVIERKWINTLIAGKPVPDFAPTAWTLWIEIGRRRVLLATRTIEYRTKREQLPNDPDGVAMIQVVRDYFRDKPHAFEHCAAVFARMMVPDIASLDVTRPSRDGGRDGIGQMRVGSGPGAILMDFALEAKCYSADNPVGVREMSRLISRLRHRQFGILVTTSWVDLQAYREIKEDAHPIVVVSAADIVSLLKAAGRRDAKAVGEWLADEFRSTLCSSKDIAHPAGCGFLGAILAGHASACGNPLQRKAAHAKLPHPSAQTPCCTCRSVVSRGERMRVARPLSDRQRSAPFRPRATPDW